MKPIQSITIDHKNQTVTITVPLDGDCQPSASGKTYHLVQPGTRPSFELEGGTLRANVMLFGSEASVNAIMHKANKATKKRAVTRKRVSK